MKRNSVKRPETYLFLPLKYVYFVDVPLLPLLVCFLIILEEYQEGSRLRPLVP